MIIRENSIVNRILRWIDKQGGVWFGKSSNICRKKAFPDLTGCIYGLRAEIEVKAPGGTPTKFQKKTLIELRKGGSIADCVWSLDDFKSILVPYEKNSDKLIKLQREIMAADKDYDYRVFDTVYVAVVVKPDAESGVIVNVFEDRIDAEDWAVRNLGGSRTYIYRYKVVPRGYRMKMPK